MYNRYFPSLPIPIVREVRCCDLRYLYVNWQSGVEATPLRALHEVLLLDEELLQHIRQQNP